MTKLMAEMAKTHANRIPAGVEHVTDLNEIARYGIMGSPALLINGKRLPLEASRHRQDQEMTDRSECICCWEIVGKYRSHIVLGIAVGAAFHGYVPEGFMASIMEKGAWWSVSASSSWAARSIC